MDRLADAMGVLYARVRKAIKNHTTMHVLRTGGDRIWTEEAVQEMVKESVRKTLYAVQDELIERSEDLQAFWCSATEKKYKDDINLQISEVLFAAECVDRAINVISIPSARRNA